MGTNEVNRDLYVSTHHLRLTLMIALGVVALGVASAFSGLGAAPLFFAVLYSIQGFWYWASPVVRLHEDQLELKTSPLSPTRTIAFADVTDVQAAGRHLSLVARTEGEERAVRIPKFLSGRDVATIAAALEARRSA